MANIKDEIEYELDDDALEEGEPSGGYKVKLEQFEGPLDLLLHLIKRAKIKICDIFVSEITSQYLAYIEENVATIDIEKAAEFLAMAAYLIEVKAKSLLPKPEVISDENQEDRESELIRRLEEYELFKEVSEKIKPFEAVGMYFRPPADNVGDERIALKDMTMDGLILALQKIYKRAEKKSLDITSSEVLRDQYTVADKITMIESILSSRNKVKFDELFLSNATKSEIIATFQAVLELMKSQYVDAQQESPFSEIILIKNNTHAPSLQELLVEDDNNGN